MFSINVMTREGNCTLVLDVPKGLFGHCSLVGGAYLYVHSPYPMACLADCI